MFLVLGAGWGTGCQFDGTGVEPQPGPPPDATSPPVDAPGDDAAPVDAPVADAPVADAPVADAPMADAPVADAPPGPPCLTSPDYVDGPANGHRYRLVSTADTWDAARQACEDDGAYLVVVDDPSENGHVGTVGNGLDRWIGLSDVATEGDFVWVTGAPSSYRNWQGAGPNNSEANDCVRMKGNSQWDVRPCAETYPFICECDPDWVP